MRVNCIPTATDVARELKELPPQSLDRLESILDQEMKALEQLLGFNILPRERQVYRKLVGNVHVLEEFPVFNVYLDEELLDVGELEGDKGIIYKDLPRRDYRLNYMVGYEDGKVPAAIQVLLLESVKVRLKIEGAEGRLEVALKVVKKLREGIQRRRDAVIADGTSLG